MPTTSVRRSWSIPAASETGWAAQVISLLNDLDSHAGFADLFQTWTAAQTYNAGVLFNAAIQATAAATFDGLLHVNGVTDFTAAVEMADLHCLGGLDVEGGGEVATLIVGAADGGNQVDRIIRATSGSLSFGSVTSTAEQNVAVTGAQVGDAVSVSPNGDPGTGYTWCGRVVSGNVVAVRIANSTGSPATPSSVTWAITVTGWV